MSVMGGPGIESICDTRLASKDNPMECAWALWRLIILVRPAFGLGAVFCAWKFPIHGQRLKDLIALQATTQKIIPGTKAHRAKMSNAVVEPAPSTTA